MSEQSDHITDPKEKAKILKAMLGDLVNVDCKPDEVNSVPPIDVNYSKLDEIKNVGIEQKKQIIEEDYKKIEEDILKDLDDEECRISKEEYENMVKEMENNWIDGPLKPIDTKPSDLLLSDEDYKNYCEIKPKPTKTPQLLREKWSREIKVYKDIIDETYEIIKSKYNNDKDYIISKKEVVTNFINQNLPDIVKSVKKRKKHQIKDKSGSLTRFCIDGYNEKYGQTKKNKRKINKDITKENIHNVISDIRNQIQTKYIKSMNTSVIIDIPKEKYNQIISVVEKFDPTFSDQIRNFSYYPEKQKEFINEYLSTKFIDILDKLQGFSTFLAAFKKDS